MNSTKRRLQLNKLYMEAYELEQANSSLRNRCKALEHILAHQALMAGMQQEIHSTEQILQQDCIAGAACCSVALQHSLNGPSELQHDCSCNPLLQCFQCSPGQGAYVAVRDSSAQDIAQAWMLLLSSVSLALHCYDSCPQQAYSRDLLCKAVTDCNRLIAAVNLLREDLWPQLWHLNLLTGSREVPGPSHWQSALAAAALTAAQLQEARDVLAVTSSKLEPVAEAVGRQLQHVSRIVDGQEGLSSPSLLQQQGVAGAHGSQQQQQQQQQELEGIQQVEQAVSGPAASSAGGATQQQPPQPATQPARQAGHQRQLGWSGGFVPAGGLWAQQERAADAAAAITAAGTAAARAAVQQQGTAAAATTSSNSSSSVQHSAERCSHSSISQGHCLQALVNLQNREDALAALTNSMSSWRVMRLMVGSLAFLMRPEQLARLYLHSMPYMPIGCLLYDQIGANPHAAGRECSDSSC